MSESEHEITAAERPIVEFLYYRVESGNSYVKTDRIAKELDTQPRSITPQIQTLIAKGVLDYWNGRPEDRRNTPTNGYIYEINKQVVRAVIDDE